MRTGRRSWAILLAVCFIAAGCTSLEPKERAKQTAIADVQDQAAEAQSGFTSRLRWIAGKNRSAADPSADQRLLRESLSGNVLKVTVDADRTAHLELVFFGHGEAGGGLSYESANVRLCVAMTGRIDANTTAEMRDLSCPDDTPAPEPGIGAIDETVQLDD